MGVLAGAVEGLDRGGTAPVGGGRDGSGEGAEADEQRVVRAVGLAGELAQRELVQVGELGGARVADVGVVRPDDDLAGRAVRGEMGAQRLQRLGHVAVAQVPRLRADAKQRAVIALGVAHEAGVLLGVEVGVGVVRVWRRLA